MKDKQNIFNWSNGDIKSTVFSVNSFSILWSEQEVVYLIRFMIDEQVNSVLLMTSTVWAVDVIVMVWLLRHQLDMWQVLSEFGRISTYFVAHGKHCMTKIETKDISSLFDWEFVC